MNTPIGGCCAADAVCDDGDACTTDRCSFGACAHNRLAFCCPGGCDDANPCTTDTCTRNDGCVHAPTTASCDDGNACTRDDRCAGGACAPGPIDCDDADPCTFDSCLGAQCRHAPLAGCCRTAAECDDLDPCTSDACSGNTCAHASIAACCASVAACDDADPCTSDACLDHLCNHAPIGGCCTSAADCNDGDPCTTDGCAAHQCGHDAIAGCCATHGQCNDDNPCTLDRCLLSECSNSPVVGHPVCNDGDACTTGDSCSDGECSGTRTSGPGCAAPVVAILAPGEGTSVPAGAGFVAEADATDADGIARVGFLIDGVQVAEDASPPWRQELFAPMTAGAHTLTVEASDGTGVVGTSSPLVFESQADPGTVLVGRVVDEAAAPIPEASVRIVDSALATTTATDGTFAFPIAPTSGALSLAVAGVRGDEPRYGTFGPFTPAVGGTTDAGDLVLIAPGVVPLPFAAIVSQPIGFTTRPGFGAAGERTPLAVVSAPIGFTTVPRIYGLTPSAVGAAGAEIVDLEIELEGIGFEEPLDVGIVSWVGLNQLAIDDAATEVVDANTLRFHLHSIQTLVANTYHVYVTTTAGASWSSDPVATLTIQ